ncbi:MAG: four helix bundle protein [Bacteroidetes bacterium]|nr:four helix bundle protein [Bacteroidota bacterium]
MLKSGTSVGANIREAQNAHSRKHFIAECVIVAKEEEETEHCQKLFLGLSKNQKL